MVDLTSSKLLAAKILRKCQRAFRKIGKEKLQFLFDDRGEIVADIVRYLQDRVDSINEGDVELFVSSVPAIEITYQKKADGSPHRISSSVWKLSARSKSQMDNHFPAFKTPKQLQKLKKLKPNQIIKGSIKTGSAYIEFEKHHSREQTTKVRTKRAKLRQIVGLGHFASDSEGSEKFNQNSNSKSNSKPTIMSANNAGSASLGSSASVDDNCMSATEYQAYHREGIIKVTQNRGNPSHTGSDSPSSGKFGSSRNH